MPMGQTSKYQPTANKWDEGDRCSDTETGRNLLSPLMWQRQIGEDSNTCKATSNGDVGKIGDHFIKHLNNSISFMPDTCI